MMLFSRRSLLTGVVAAAVVSLGVCGSSPETKQSTFAPVLSGQLKEFTTSTSPTPETSPKPFPSSSQSASPEASKPNISHNNAAAGYAYPSEKVQVWMKDSSSAPERIVFLTLDDDPNHTNLVQILDALKVDGVHGMSFVVGNLVSSALETLKCEIAGGRSVVMHSYIHNYNKLYSGHAGSLETIKDEYNKTEATFEEVLSADFKTNIWCYPGDHMSQKKLEAADEALTAEGVHWIDWSCLTGDAEPENCQSKDVMGMVKMATSAIGESLKVAVMLAHDVEGRDMAVKAMPQIISAYKGADYKFGIIV